MIMGSLTSITSLWLNTGNDEVEVDDFFLLPPGFESVEGFRGFRFRGAFPRPPEKHKP